MITGTMHVEAEYLRGIRVIKQTSLDRNLVSLDIGQSPLWVWMDPKDLPRVASMFRHAAESIEAIIAQNGANHAPEAIRDLPAPSLANAA